MRALVRFVAVAAVALCARPALAQAVDPELFGDGKPPVFREEDPDRRFLKTGIYAALSAPPKDAACRRVLATLLTAYAESLLYIHRRDQNFMCDPALLQTLRQSILTNDFAAFDYLQAMIRRTMIDKKVPAAWIKTAETLRAEQQAPIAVARMALFENGVEPIDSFSFTVPALLDRYHREVQLAPSVSVDSAEDKFRDKYMDRDVAWGGLILHDIAQQAPPEPPKKKGKKSKQPEPTPADPPPELPTWAVVGFPVGKPTPPVPGVPGSGQVPELEIRVRLKDGQPMDLTKFVRGQRVLVKGHLWDVSTGLGYIELRDAYLFADPDWSTWSGVATPADVYNCNIAVNDLSPYGYKVRPGQKPPPNPFQHTKE